MLNSLRRSLLRPVMPTDSFSRAAAASGALFSPVSAECTFLDVSVTHTRILSPVMFEGREIAPVSTLDSKGQNGDFAQVLRRVVELPVGRVGSGITSAHFTCRSLRMRYRISSKASRG